ncbi:hypothetical protein BDZ94DRAFT_1307689 [Collybia nuda]|uniref:Cyclin-D1-binding protein 1 n=1 Tax=Collybia nuda TaxID=64659 RepID=A0A9P5Y9M2_9AGAR|nr:hypothetical protein BDZ94DRAFT_1307689 [Collybia nuda]
MPPDLNKQKSIAALSLVVETSNSTITSLISYKAGDVADSPLTDQSVLHKDLLSLFSLLQVSTTKLSLALKPSSPTYGASLGPLKDLVDQISALSHCVHLYHHNLGITLTQEVGSVTSDIIQSVRVLCQTFLDNEINNTRTSTGQPGDEYMVRTGAVHDLINKAKVPGGLSVDNVSAVRKKLTQDHASLEDALSEVCDMASETQVSSEDNMDDEDDGWGLLGMKSKRMDTAEVYAILRLSTLLHKNIIEDVLSTDVLSLAAVTPRAAQHLDTLPPHSSALLAASDDLISTLYAPQNLSEIATELSSFLDVVRQLHSSLTVIYENPSSLVQQMAQINLRDGNSKNLKKWFDVCFDQVGKAAEVLRTTLDLDTKNST